MCHSSFQLRPLPFQVRTGNSQNDDHRGYQLQHKCRHVKSQCNGIHQTENKGTKNHSHRSYKDPAFSQDGTADEKGSQCDGNHSLTDVDIHRFL